MELFENGEKHMSYFDMTKDLTSLKKELEWLKEVPSTALTYCLKDLDNAYQRYFKDMKKSNYVRYSKKLLEHLGRIGKKPSLYLSDGHPKFKKKKNHRKSYKTQNSNNKAVEVIENRIKLPKLGTVKYRGSQIVEGRILSATVSQEPSGKYYCSLCCTDVEIEQYPKTNKNVGIDLGIKEFAIFSTGEKIENPKCLKKSLERLKKLQKALSRKQIGSARWNRNRIKVAKLQEHIANQRSYFLHNLTTDLIRNHDVICLEDLQVKNMMKNHKLAQSISDVSWYEFVRQLTYKAEWRGREISKIDKFYPSSQLCHVCGFKNTDVKDLNIRKWICPECKTKHDRDCNAAINILKEGVRLLSA